MSLFDSEVWKVSTKRLNNRVSALIYLAYNGRTVASAWLHIQQASVVEPGVGG